MASLMWICWRWRQHKQQASQLADALLSAGLGDDVIALSSARWQALRFSGDPYWTAIHSDAVPLVPQ